MVSCDAFVQTVNFFDNEPDNTNARASDLARQAALEKLAAEERNHISTVAKLEIALQEKTATVSQLSAGLKATEVSY